MKNKLSIIIPVYNTDKYLSKCLNSVVSQKYENIEVILINDGSTDKSIDIMKSFAEKYGFIKLYDRENMGIAEERNFGILKSTGDYFTFLDSDDYVDNNLYLECMNYINSVEIDILMHNFTIEYEGKSTQSTIITYEDKKDMYIKNLPNPWNKIIKKDFWTKTNINFPKGIWYEDLATLPILYLYTNKINYIPIYGYHYIIRNESITHRTKYDNHCMDILLALEKLKTEFNKKNQIEKIEYLFIVEGLYFGTQAPIEFNKINEYKKIINFVEDVFPNWRKNECISTLPIAKQLYLKFIKNYRILKIMIKLRKLARL